MPDQQSVMVESAPVGDDGPRTVGRAAEMRIIASLFDKLADGSGSFLQIAGEPGIGKTHLLASVREMAVERGITVLSSRAGEFEHRMPFQVLTEALHDRVSHEGLDRLVPPGQVAMLTPLLAGPWAAHRPGSPRERDVDFDRFQLFQALRQLLIALAAEPLVVMFDDVHWADPGSVDFISFLSRHQITVPLLVVVSHRGRQAPARLRYALARDSDHGSVVRIELGPLSRTEAAALIRRRAGSRTLEELYQESQGNPLYLLTLDRRVAEASRPDIGPGWRGGDISSRLESLILGEIAALSPQEMTVASAAAVIGDPFSVDLLAEVAELTGSAVSASLHKLVDLDMIRSGSNGPALAFRHPLVRSVIYNRTSPVWRMGAHRRSLSRLSALGAPAAARARHIEHGVTEWTAEYGGVLEQAGHESMSTSPLSAAHWFSVELGLMPETADFAARRFETSYLLARAMCLGGRFSESRALLHKILHDAPAQAAIDRSAAVVLCAHADQRLGRYAEATALLRQEITRLGDQGASAQRVSLCLELALTAVLANDYATTRPDIAWALDTAHSTGDTLSEATALAFGAFGEICTGQAELARKTASEAARLVDGLPDTALVDEREALSMLGWAEILLERFVDAERHLARSRAIIRRTGQSHGLPHVQLGQCLVSMFTGRMSEALERAADAEDAAHLVGSDHLLGIVLAIKAPILVWVSPRGEGGSALVAARRATALFAGDANSWWGRTALLLRGHAELTNGDPQACVSLLLRGGGEDLRQLGAPLLAEYAEILVGALIKLGEVRRAERYARDAVQFADRLSLAGQQAHAARALGLVLAAYGDQGCAYAQFRRAERWFDESGKAVEQARTAVFAARALASLDRSGEALPLLDRAVVQAEACGARWVRDELASVREQLAGAARGQATDAIAEHPGAATADARHSAMSSATALLQRLTEREHEVATLVERGRTNRQIASALRLSERTVESHLANIYRKLDLPTRAALAAILGAETARGAAP
jgi:DNA-binding NarL/FixJ family response regulator/tetratricopeptide (TPR) repeat protein